MFLSSGHLHQCQLIVRAKIKIGTPSRPASPIRPQPYRVRPTCSQPVDDWSEGTLAPQVVIRISGQMIPTVKTSGTINLILPHVQSSLDLGSKLWVVMDELIASEVQSVEHRECGQQCGGNIIELIMSQIKIGQIGQNSIKWSAPPYYVENKI